MSAPVKGSTPPVTREVTEKEGAKTTYRTTLTGGAGNKTGGRGFDYASGGAQVDIVHTVTPENKAGVDVAIGGGVGGKVIGPRGDHGGKGVTGKGEVHFTFELNWENAWKRKNGETMKLRGPDRLDLKAGIGGAGGKTQVPTSENGPLSQTAYPFKAFSPGVAAELNLFTADIRNGQVFVGIFGSADWFLVRSAGDTKFPNDTQRFLMFGAMAGFAFGRVRHTETTSETKITSSEKICSETELNAAKEEYAQLNAMIGSESGGLIKEIADAENDFIVRLEARPDLSNDRKAITFVVNSIREQLIQNVQDKEGLNHVLEYLENVVSLTDLQKVTKEDIEKIIKEEKIKDTAITTDAVFTLLDKALVAPQANSNYWDKIYLPAYDENFTTIDIDTYDINNCDELAKKLAELKAHVNNLNDRLVNINKAIGEIKGAPYPKESAFIGFGISIKAKRYAVGQPDAKDMAAMRDLVAKVKARGTPATKAELEELFYGPKKGKDYPKKNFYAAQDVAESIMDLRALLIDGTLPGPDSSIKVDKALLDHFSKNGGNVEAKLSKFFKGIGLKAIGFADDQGLKGSRKNAEKSDAYNKQLANDRGEYFGLALQAISVPDNRIKSEGRGNASAKRVMEKVNLRNRDEAADARVEQRAVAFEFFIVEDGEASTISSSPSATPGAVGAKAESPAPAPAVAPTAEAKAVAEAAARAAATNPEPTKAKKFNLNAMDASQKIQVEAELAKVDEKKRAKIQAKAASGVDEENFAAFFAKLQKAVAAEVEKEAKQKALAKPTKPAESKGTRGVDTKGLE